MTPIDWKLVGEKSLWGLSCLRHHSLVTPIDWKPNKLAARPARMKLVTTRWWHLLIGELISAASMALLICCHHSLLSTIDLPLCLIASPSSLRNYMALPTTCRQGLFIHNFPVNSCNPKRIWSILLWNINSCIIQMLFKPVWPFFWFWTMIRKAYPLKSASLLNSYA